LFSGKSMPYPFAASTGKLDDVIVGTLLEWPNPEVGRQALAACDGIERCFPDRPAESLYQRCPVDVEIAGRLDTCPAWIYYQSLPTDLEGIVCIEGGDWMARRSEQSQFPQTDCRETPQSHLPAKPDVPVFAAWVLKRMALGDSACSICSRIGAAQFMEDAQEDFFKRALEAFTAQHGTKACELIRQLAMQRRIEPGIPFSRWLQERWDNGATAKQVLDVLQLPASEDATKSDAELWQGFWVLAEEESAWQIVKEMSCPRLREAPPRKSIGPTVGAFDDVVTLMKQSCRILVLTGAGISESCGIPTYRDSTGFYAQVLKEEFGMSNPEEVNDINFFRKDPKPWFKHVQKIIPTSSAPRSPSMTHRFIRSLEDRGKLLWQYTQNIDGLEATAGITRVTCCHGSFATATCIKCAYHVADGTEVNDRIASGEIPVCVKCNGVLKPDVVLFNEPMPKGVRKGIEKHTDSADLLIVIGTSLKVTPCSLIPSLVGLGDAPRVLINPEPVGRSTDFEHFLEGKADAVIEQLLNRLQWNFATDEQVCMRN
jgi:NAD-dependent SIR2 family protein deacetylase